MPFPWMAAAAAATPFISQGLNFLGNSAGMRKQYHMNKGLAERQYELDIAMMEYMNRYNSPVLQRKRMEEAGYNPNLFYGQGTPGNMTSAPQAPKIEAPNIAAIYGDIGTKLQESRLLASQADLTDQRVKESGVKQELNKAQTNLVKANPYMRKEYVDSMVSIMTATAELKQSDRNVLLETQSSGYNRGQEKVISEVESLATRLNLLKADQKVKSEIIQSKQFQNALQEIQVKWLKDGEITPQHIYMGIMLLLQKMM